MILYRVSRVVVEGMLRGKCIPADTRVNESVHDYIVRAFNAGADAQRDAAQYRNRVKVLEGAATALLSDIASRYPGQEFTCPHIRKLAQLIDFEVKP